MNQQESMACRHIDRLSRVRPFRRLRGTIDGRATLVRCLLLLAVVTSCAAGASVDTAMPSAGLSEPSADSWSAAALRDIQSRLASLSAVRLRRGAPQRQVPQPVRPHQSVARIIVPERGATAYGTGTLIDVRDQYGLVVTNWHVVRDATSAIEVTFPSGFRSRARALKVDEDWDLAALVIWRPPLEPVRLAASPPRSGDRLTIHGYGQGDYRVASGHCTQYYAPRLDLPQEMVELDVEARQGDSGGPIFNERGELAGVLFGAGQGTTIGSFNRRVASFLATLAPDIGGPVNGPLMASALPPPLSAYASLPPTGAGAAESSSVASLPGDPTAVPPCEGSCQMNAAASVGCPHGACPVDASAPRADTVAADHAAAGFTPWPASSWPSETSNSPDGASQSEWTVASPPAAVEAPTPPPPVLLSDDSVLGRIEMVLAIVGLLAICLQIVRVVS